MESTEGCITRAHISTHFHAFFHVEFAFKFNSIKITISYCAVTWGDIGKIGDGETGSKGGQLGIVKYWKG